MGKTTSSINTVGEMESNTVDLDAYIGPSTILGPRPEGEETSVKIPKTVDELVEIMTPYKNSDRTLFIDYGGFNSDLTRTAIAFTDYIIVPSKNSLAKHIGLMHFDGVLNGISSIVGTDITTHLHLRKVNPNKRKFPKLDVILPSFKHLEPMKSRIFARTEFEDAIKTGAGITGSIHERCSAGDKEVIALAGEINHPIENNKQ